ncbi:MAG: glycosyltransferase family 2 protein [Microgenomates group bacterium]
MPKLIKSLSVFFPAYNEEANIEKTVKRAKEILLKTASEWEILIINDGSKDKTLEISRKLAKSDKRIKVVNHGVNKGYGAALKSGFHNAKYSWIVFTDSDGQFDFSEIKKFLPLMKNSDLILGYRLKRADSFIRRIYTFVWGMIPAILWGLNVRDYSCGFKVIKKRVFETVQPLVGEEKVTQIEMLVKAKRKGFRFAEVGVHHYPRKYGAQTGANIKVVTKSIIDLFKLWKKLR